MVKEWIPVDFEIVFKQGGTRVCFVKCYGQSDKGKTFNYVCIGLYIQMKQI